MVDKSIILYVKWGCFEPGIFLLMKEIKISESPACKYYTGQLETKNG